MSAPRPDAPVGITMGDAAGIGPEIVARLFAGGPAAPAVVLGDAGAMRRALPLAGAPLAVVEVSSPEEALSAGPGSIPVLATSALPDDLTLGVVDGRAGKAAHDAIVAAVDLAMAGRLRAVVTAPIHKEALKAGGIAHPGHTEILAERSGTSEFAMMLASRELRVLLVSIHVSLREAIALVTPEAEDRAIRLAALACRGFGIETIAPAVERARAAGLDASGPWPPDTIFMRARRGEFDVVVAQYHDQGLIPVKYLGIDEGVNVTVGLPFVRTSVDHGTAFDIAGKGVADPSSLVLAFETALAMTGG